MPPSSIDILINGVTLIIWRCISGRSHIGRWYLFIVIDLILALFAFDFWLIFIEEVWETEEPISLDCEIEDAILKCVLLGDKQLGEEGFLEAEYSFDFQGFIPRLLILSL